MYSKDQMRQFGDWLASRKDVVTGSQIDEYIDAMTTVSGADVVESGFKKVGMARVISEELYSRIMVRALMQKELDRNRAGQLMLTLKYIEDLRNAPIIEAEVERRVRERSKE